MATCAILGGGFAGLMAAEQLVQCLGRKDEVVVINDTDTLVYRPSLPWIVTGDRRPEDICLSLEKAARRKGFTFLKDSVRSVQPNEDRVLTHKTSYPYNFLLVALGAELDWDSVPGAREHAHTLMHLPAAVRLHEALRDFRGGDLVVAIGPKAPCLSPAYEAAFELDTLLRKRGIRAKTRLRFVTPEKRLYTCATPAVAERVARRFRRLGIEAIAAASVTRIRKGGVELANGETLPSDLTVFVPRYRGQGAMRSSQGLVDQQGFVPVDLEMRARGFPNLFAAGDCVAFPGPKTGRMAELQAKVAVHNIIRLLTGRGQPARYHSELLVITETGADQGMFNYRIKVPGQGETHIQLAAPGRLPHYGKVMFEKYWLFRHRWF